MILYRKSSVEHTPVFEELLLGLLHLHDERLALLVLTIYIEDSTAVAIAIAEVLAIEIGKITHHFLAFEKRVEEANQQFLVKRGTEQLLKAEVRVGIDISTFSHFLYLSYASVCHVLAHLGVSDANIGIVFYICKLFGLIVSDSFDGRNLQASIGAPDNTGDIATLMNKGWPFRAPATASKRRPL